MKLWQVELSGYPACASPAYHAHPSANSQECLEIPAPDIPSNPSKYRSCESPEVDTNKMIPTTTTSINIEDPERLPQRTPIAQSINEQVATTRQVVRACVRCRKQKSKCDAFRPCSVCVKANVECISTSTDSHNNNVRSRLSEERPTKVRRIATCTQSARGPEPECSQEISTTPKDINQNVHRSLAFETQAQAEAQDESQSNIRTQTQPQMSNEDDVNVKEANMNTKLFTLTPGHLMENSSPYRHQNDTNTDWMSSPSTSSFIPDAQCRAILPWSYSRASAVSLLAALPPRPVTDYLIAVYFNTVHWFMVVVHEGHFMYHYRTMMDLYVRDAKLVSNSDEDFTFAVLVLLVAALGARYTSIHATRARRCKQIYLDYYQSMSKSKSRSHAQGPDDFDLLKTTSQIFYIVRSNSTDILACGTLATVQSLLLLGSLYLFHGESNLAWTNSGCAVRAAHTLGLHKEDSELRWNSPYYQRMDPAEKLQLRRRLFWAIHTSDRFLAMCYGLPMLIADDDCVAGMPCEDNIYPPPECSSFLMIEDDLRNMPGSAEGRPKTTTLLTYQTYKLHIYIILGQIISRLFRPLSGGCDILLSKYEDPALSTCSHSSHPKSPRELIETVQQLEAKLRNWYNDIPPPLRLSADMTYPACNESIGINVDGEDIDDNDDEIIIPAYDDFYKHSSKVQKRRAKVKNEIYGMQALLLQLAYDNALILMHRPILALKNRTPQELFSLSVDTCWKATLRISSIGKHHIFHRNQQAHAVSHVGIHLFTAGVILSVFGSSDPLSRRAWEAKKALSRIIRMQRQLGRKVIVSGQGLAILENLAREVVRKEMEAILAQEMDGLDDGGYPIPSRNTAQSSSNINDRMLPSGELPYQAAHLGPERQQDIHPITGIPVNHTDNLTELPLNFSDNLILNNDMFSESVLDIEKFLSDPQLLPTPENGMNNNIVPPTDNAAQQAGIWWFNFE